MPIELKQYQIDSLARYFYEKMYDFWADPENRRRYDEFYIKKYGHTEAECLANPEYMKERNRRDMIYNEKDKFVAEALTPMLRAVMPDFDEAQYTYRSGNERVKLYWHGGRVEQAEMTGPTIIDLICDVMRVLRETTLHCNE